jgi:hypothetical protein
MKTIPYRCDESRHNALLGALKASGTSVQRLFDNFVTHVLAEHQLEARFAVRQNRGKSRAWSSFAGGGQAAIVIGVAKATGVGRHEVVDENAANLR